MARRSAGVSGTAVLFGAAGIYLAYAGIKDVPLVSGLRSLLRGKAPAEGAGTPYAGPNIAAAVAAAGPATTGVGSTDAAGTESIASGGPVPMSSTTLVRGIRVHKQISGAVGRMIDAAAADGVTLNGVGGGWRSSAQQQALRLKNGCTCSNSSSCCRVPTAPVGKSMHERGLAIDFANSRTRDTKVYRWLAANAARFGFKNLPSEPWHWSTNGT